MHVTVDGWRRERREGPAWTGAAVEQFLDRAVTHSGLTVIAGPVIKQFEGHIHGWAMIGESHVAVDLDIQRDEAHLELCSCREFDADGFVNLCVSSFGLRGYRTNILDRGLYRMRGAAEGRAGE